MAVAVGSSGKTGVGVGVAVAGDLGAEVAAVVAVGVGVAGSVVSDGVQLGAIRLIAHKASQKQKLMYGLRFMISSLDLSKPLSCFQAT